MSNKVFFLKKGYLVTSISSWNQNTILVVSILSQILTGMFAVYPLIKRVALSALKVTYDKTIFW